MAKGRVRGFVVGFFGEVSSDTLTFVRHCVDMIAYRVWKRSGFSSVSVDSHQSGGRWIWYGRWKAKENEKI
jgi:hypothetical protein